MSIVKDDAAGAVAAFVSGAIVGVAATLLFVRLHSRRDSSAIPHGNGEGSDDYLFDGGDIFI